MQPGEGFNWLNQTPSSAAPRFLTTIAHATRADERQSASTDLARDIIRDVREILRVACAKARCGPLIWTADGALASLVEAPSLSYRRLDQAPAKTEPFGHEYRWTLTGAGRTVESKCEDHFNGLTHRIFCWIDVHWGSPIGLRYSTFDNRITLTDPAGSVEFLGRPFVVISGSALALSSGPL